MKLEIKGKDIVQEVEDYIGLFTMALGILLLSYFIMVMDNVMDRLIISSLVVFPIYLSGFFLLLRVLKEGYYEEFKKEQEEVSNK